jgi:DNA-binding MarR family transcriptional regulator
MPTSDIQRRLLEAIEENPDTTQANLAAQLGVAVGSVNWYMKRLVRKGYVKVTRLQRRKLKYFLTPQGLALKAHLTSQYIKASLRVYSELRQAARETCLQVKEAGYEALYLEADGEAAEIFRLTCLELGVRVLPLSENGTPTVSVEGIRFVVGWPEPMRQSEERVQDASTAR